VTVQAIENLLSDTRSGESLLRRWEAEFFYTNGSQKLLFAAFSRAYGARKEKKGLRVLCALRTKPSTLFSQKRLTCEPTSAQGRLLRSPVLYEGQDC